MVITYNGSSVLLQGLNHGIPDELVIQLCSISPEEATSDSQELHPAIAALLQEFASVFTPVDGLPPKRSCDHSILL